MPGFVVIECVFVFDGFFECGDRRCVVAVGKLDFAIENWPGDAGELTPVMKAKHYQGGSERIAEMLVFRDVTSSKKEPVTELRDGRIAA